MQVEATDHGRLSTGVQSSRQAPLPGSVAAAKTAAPVRLTEAQHNEHVAAHLLNFREQHSGGIPSGQFPWMYFALPSLIWMVKVFIGDIGYRGFGCSCRVAAGLAAEMQKHLFVEHVSHVLKDQLERYPPAAPPQVAVGQKSMPSPGGATAAPETTRRSRGSRQARQPRQASTTPRSEPTPEGSVWDEDDESKLKVSAHLRIVRPKIRMALPSLPACLPALPLFVPEVLLARCRWIFRNSRWSNSLHVQSPWAAIRSG